MTKKNKETVLNNAARYALKQLIDKAGKVAECQDAYYDMALDTLVASKEKDKDRLRYDLFVAEHAKRDTEAVCDAIEYLVKQLGFDSSYDFEQSFEQK